jgi:hypothetical protein
MVTMRLSGGDGAGYQQGYGPQQALAVVGPSESLRSASQHAHFDVSTSSGHCVAFLSMTGSLLLRSGSQVLP